MMNTGRSLAFVIIPLLWICQNSYAQVDIGAVQGQTFIIKQSQGCRIDQLRLSPTGYSRKNYGIIEEEYVCSNNHVEWIPKEKEKANDLSATCPYCGWSGYYIGSELTDRGFFKQYRCTKDHIFLIPQN